MRTKIGEVFHLTYYSKRRAHLLFKGIVRKRDYMRVDVIKYEDGLWTPKKHPYFMFDYQRELSNLSEIILYDKENYPEYYI
jgi:hypothetical protein